MHHFRWTLGAHFLFIFVPLSQHPVQPNNEQSVQNQERAVKRREDVYVFEEVVILESDQKEGQRQADILCASLEADGAALDVWSPKDEGEEITKDVTKERQDEGREPELPGGCEHGRIDDSIRDDVD